MTDMQYSTRAGRAYSRIGARNSATILVAAAIMMGNLVPAHASEREEFLFPSLNQLSTELTGAGSSALGNDPDSPANQAAREAQENKSRRRATVLHYGVTTQAEIDACKADTEHKVITLEGTPYERPCPSAPITKEDVEQAQREQVRWSLIHVPLQIVGFLFSVVMLPLNWVWNGLRGERENFFASS